jgi:hypothetical protein
MSEAEILDKMIRKAALEVDKLRAQLQLEERFLAKLQALREDSEPISRLPGSSLPFPDASSGASPNGTARVLVGSTAWHVREILDAAGHELDLRDIVRELGSRGVTVNRPGGIKARVRTLLRSRPDLFERVKDQIFDLRARRKREQSGNDRHSHPTE